MDKNTKKRLHTFGDKVRMIRKSQGFSQESFAMKAGLDRSYIGGIERGERNITFETMCLIANALNIELSKLLDQI